MEELLTLKDLLHQGKVVEALLLVEELAAMSKSDKLNKIFSYGVIILLNLIKQAAEKRTTRTWEISIFNAVRQIQRLNRRYQTDGYYFTESELRKTLDEAYEVALKNAELEAFEGMYNSDYISERINKNQIIEKSISLLEESFS